MTFGRIFDSIPLDHYLLKNSYYRIHIRKNPKIGSLVNTVTNEDWCVAVFKCRPNDIRKVLLDFYKFVKNTEGVKSLHFLIRDRVEDEVVFSFRVLIEKEKKRIIGSKMIYELGTLLSEDKFAVDPDVKHPLRKYVAWSFEDRVAKSGVKKFTEFCSLLEKMSKLVIQMIKSKYFSSDERVEIAHVMSWMLGCAEYGLLSTTHIEVGYFDRIEDKYCIYLRQNFPKQQETSK